MLGPAQAPSHSVYVSGIALFFHHFFSSCFVRFFTKKNQVFPRLIHVFFAFDGARGFFTYGMFQTDEKINERITNEKEHNQSSMPTNDSSTMAVVDRLDIFCCVNRFFFTKKIKCFPV